MLQEVLNVLETSGEEKKWATLDIRSTTSEELQAIAKAIADSSIRTISFSNTTKFTQELGSALARFLPQNTTLLTLHHYDPSNFDSQSRAQIYDVLERNNDTSTRAKEMIKKLKSSNKENPVSYLAGYGLMTDEAKEIAEAIRVNTTVTEIAWRGIGISNVGAKMIADAIDCNEHIKLGSLDDVDIWFSRIDSAILRQAKARIQSNFRRAYFLENLHAVQQNHVVNGSSTIMYEIDDNDLIMYAEAFTNSQVLKLVEFQESPQITNLGARAVAIAMKTNRVITYVGFGRECKIDSEILDEIKGYVVRNKEPHRLKALTEFYDAVRNNEPSVKLSIENIRACESEMISECFRENTMTTEAAFDYPIHDEDGERLSELLKVNKTLTKVSFKSLTNVAAAFILHALEHNLTLVEVNSSIDSSGYHHKWEHSYRSDRKEAARLLERNRQLIHLAREAANRLHCLTHEAARLHTLVWNKQQVSLEEIKQLAVVLSKNHSIREIELAQEWFEDERAHVEFADALEHNETLIKLVAGGKSLGVKCSRISASLGRNQLKDFLHRLITNDPKFVSLDWSGHKVTEDDIKRLASALKVNHTLQTIQFDETWATDVNLEAFVDILATNQTLLACNFGIGSSSIMGGLYKRLKRNRFRNFLERIRNNNCDALKLCALEIDDSDAIQIASLLRHNTGLFSINFQGNRITDIGARALGEAIAFSQRQVTFKFNDNRVSYKTLCWLNLILAYNQGFPSVNIVRSYVLRSDFGLPEVLVDVVIEYLWQIVPKKQKKKDN